MRSRSLRLDLHQVTVPFITRYIYSYQTDLGLHQSLIVSLPLQAALTPASAYVFPNYRCAHWSFHCQESCLPSIFTDSQEKHHCISLSPLFPLHNDGADAHTKHIK